MSESSKFHVTEAVPGQEDSGTMLDNDFSHHHHPMSGPANEAGSPKHVSAHHRQFTDPCASDGVCTAVDSTSGSNTELQSVLPPPRVEKREHQPPPPQHRPVPVRHDSHATRRVAVSLFSEHMSSNSNAQLLDVDAEETASATSSRGRRNGDPAFHNVAATVPLTPPTLLPPPRTPVGQMLHATSTFASPLSVNTPAPSMRRKGAGTAGRSLHLAPSASTALLSRGAIPAFGTSAESPLITAPSPATPAKQRRTVHPTPRARPRLGNFHQGGSTSNNNNSDEETIISAGMPRPSPGRAGNGSAMGTDASASRMHGTSNETVSPSSSAAVGPFRVPTLSSSKYARSETSRKRSADVMAEMSALDIEASIGSPTQQSAVNATGSNYNLVTPTHSVSSFVFPSQPLYSQQQQQGPQRGGGVGVFLPVAAAQLGGGGHRVGGNHNHNGGGSVGVGLAYGMPNSPLLSGGYATPTALSQHIDISRAGESLSQMLARPSQDTGYFLPSNFGGGAAPPPLGGGADYSQAETEYSNIFTKKILVDFREVRELGQGAFGKVALYEEGSTGDLVAVKVSAPLHRGADQDRIFRRERAIMQFLKGKTTHIVQLLNSWEEGRVPQVYLQLEYCPGGSVSSFAERKRIRKEAWEESEVLVFLVHMAIALDCMHRENIAHVDFKPDNVLMDAYGNYKLSDFGCSVALDEEGRPCREPSYPSGLAGRGQQAIPSESKDGLTAEQLAVWQQQQQQQQGEDRERDEANARNGPFKSSGALPGDVGYLAKLQPLESTQLSMISIDEGDCRYLCADMLNQKRYLKAGDMFSLGISLYELMSGEPLPKSGDAFLQLRRAVPTHVLKQRGYSQRLIDLVVALLKEEPTERPTARQVLQYLRPADDILAALGDEARMRAWTTPQQPMEVLAKGDTRGAEQNEEPSGAAQGEQSSSPSSGSSGLAFKQLRLASALVEASHWLLETTLRDHMQRNNMVLLSSAPPLPASGTRTMAGTPVAGCAAGGPGPAPAFGHSSSYVFSPPSCVTPANASSPPTLNTTAQLSSPGFPRGGGAMPALQQQLFADSSTANLQGQRNDASTPLTGVQGGQDGWQWGSRGR